MSFKWFTCGEIKDKLKIIDNYSQHWWKRLFLDEKKIIKNDEIFSQNFYDMSQLIIIYYGGYEILVQKVFERDLSHDGKCKELKF